MTLGIGIRLGLNPTTTSSFAPTDIATVSHWFDAADTGTVTDSGTTLTISNKASGGVTSIFGSFSDKPAYVSGSHIAFSGHLMQSGLGYAWGANHTIFIVCGKDGVSGQEVFLTLDGTQNEVSIGSDSTGTRLTCYDGGSGLQLRNIVNSQGALLNGDVMILALRLTATAGRFYINGTEQTGAPNKTWGSSSRGAGLFYVGGFGSNNREANNLNIYEIIIADETSDSTFDTLQDYLLSKHGL